MTSTAILRSPQAQQAITEIASAFGIDKQQAAPVIKSLAEAVNHRFVRATLNRGGIADIVRLLGEKQAGTAIDNPTELATPEVTAEGNHVLDVLIGNKHISRGIAASAVRNSSIDAATAEKLLPVVASMMVGGLQKEAAPQLARIVDETPALRGLNQQPTNQQPMNQKPLPLPGDDIPGLGRRTPAPSAPDNPFDNLPDIIRRGGTSVPGGGSLENIIRSILNSLLGNANRGVIGTIVQAFILRWLVNLARRFLGRIAVGG